MLLVITLACFTFGVQAQGDIGAKKQTLFTNVMDPESGLDAVRNVGVKDGKIAIVTDKALVS